MTLDLVFLKDLISVLGFVLAVASGGYTYVATRRKDVERQFKVGSDRMDRHELRLASLEQTVGGLPSAKDIHNIELHIERMSGALGRMEAVMEGNRQIMSRLETIVTRHEDHLLSKG